MQAKQEGSNFVFVEDHVGYSVHNGILSFTVRANKFAFHYMGLYKIATTSKIILCNFRSSSSFYKYSGVRSLGKLVSPMSVTVL